MRIMVYKQTAKGRTIVILPGRRVGKHPVQLRGITKGDLVERVSDGIKALERQLPAGGPGP